jgi:hypothetical protein
MTLIEISFYAPAPKGLNLSGFLMLELFLPANKYWSGQRVVQSEGNELG